MKPRVPISRSSSFIDSPRSSSKSQWAPPLTYAAAYCGGTDVLSTSGQQEDQNANH